MLSLTQVLFKNALVCGKKTIFLLTYCTIINNAILMYHNKYLNEVEATSTHSSCSRINGLKNKVKERSLISFFYTNINVGYLTWTLAVYTSLFAPTIILVEQIVITFVNYLTTNSVTIKIHIFQDQ